MTTLTETRQPGTRPLLDVEVLRTFVAIAESGSFTRAARQVYRTPSAVSMQIRRLEETLGRKLFVREARRVYLTPEGEMLLSYGRRLLRLNEEAIGHFLAPPLEGRVSLGTTDDVGTRVLPGLLAQFSRSYPAVQVDVAVGASTSMVRRLEEGELDLALVTTGQQDVTRQGEVVHREPLVWAGRTGGAAARRAPLPVALANPGCPWRKTALDALDRAGMDYRVAYTCEHCAGQEAAMLADLAVAPFPLTLVRPPLRRLDGDLLPPLGDYQVSLLRRDGLGATGEHLAALVVEAFRGQHAW
ncbi:MAG: LysR family transcriptional regulator [Ectothiorhodospiraceae bacterium]|nr:LysR family transcriptional regulator [Ectothiorhodospiraceae bacterium]